MGRWVIIKRLVADYGLTLVYWLKDNKENRVIKVIPSDLVEHYKKLKPEGTVNFYVRNGSIVLNQTKGAYKTKIFKPSLKNIVIPMAKKRDERRNMHMLYAGNCYNNVFLRHTFVEYILHEIDKSSLIKPLAIEPSVKTPFGTTSADNVSMGSKTAMLFLCYVLNGIEDSVCLMSAGHNARVVCCNLIELFNLLHIPIKCRLWFYHGFDATFEEWEAQADMEGIKGELLDLLDLG